MAIEFKLPDLGENIEAGEVINVLVAEGDTIEPEQGVLELETDKAIVEVPCPHGGRVGKIHVRAGDHVPVGALLLTIEGPKPAAGATAAGAGVEESKEPPPHDAKVAAVSDAAGHEPSARPAEPPVAPPPVTPPVGEARPARAPAPASPSVRRLARELGVDLDRVAGTGSGGRITEDDVKSFVRQAARPAYEPAAKPDSGVEVTRAAGTPLPVPAAAGAARLPNFAQWGPVQREPFGGIRRKAAERLSLAWQVVPHVTQYDQADVTELEAQRKQYVAERAGRSGKITITALAIKAAAAALKAYPRFNSSLDAAAGELVLKNYYHIGVAVDTEHGLIVPVIRDVDRKSVVELAVELEQVAERARQRKVDLAELQGGTFTITNLGGIGGTAFAPLVNYPEVAILGLARARHEQVVRDGRPEIRLILPLSLSYDHRVIDGAAGARFIRMIAEILSEPLELMMRA